mmetsp:Transcript_17198/g.35911  ORF Transcript_17198/g.35911 Transcript_17198/m.35911 type:complete len:211 (-) Transcript_17198:289-921(-)
MCCIARILPINVNTIKAIFSHKLHGVGHEVSARGWIFCHHREWLRERPPSNRRIYCSTGVMDETNKAGFFYMVVTHFRIRSRPRAPATRGAFPACSSVQIDVSKEEAWISPVICPPDISSSINLKKCEVYASNFIEVHVRWFCQFGTIVPLPRRVVANYLLVMISNIKTSYWTSSRSGRNGWGFGALYASITCLARRALRVGPPRTAGPT